MAKTATTTDPPKGGQTTASPVVDGKLILEARTLVEDVYREWATMRALEEAWLTANKQNVEAGKAIVGETIANGCSGAALTELLARCRTNREERDRCRAAFEEANTGMVDMAGKYMARKKALTDMGVRLGLPASGVLPSPLPSGGASAIIVLIKQVGERAFKVDYQSLIDERQKALPKKPAAKRPSPARESFQLLFDALSSQVAQAIQVYEKTLAAKKEAEAAVKAIEALDEEQIVEPMKPTAEEVGRYIFEIDKRSRLHIPAQRMAAISVLKFRRQMLALYDAYKDLGPPLRKMGYLESYQIEVEVEALIVASRKICEYFRQIHFEWMRLVDRWCSLEYDTSTPVEEQPIEELEIVELLEAQIRNLGVAVANKSIAGTKANSLKCVVEQQLPTNPNFSYYDPDKMEDEYAKASAYLDEFAAVASANEVAEAKRAMACDAFEARQELARRLSAKLSHTVGVIGSTLKKPMSDQLRVMFFSVRLLYQLNGGPAANAKG